MTQGAAPGFALHFALDYFLLPFQGSGNIQSSESPKGTHINSCGSCAATRSETHGAQKVLLPTLKGLNRHERSADAFCSTLSRGAFWGVKNCCQTSINASALGLGENLIFVLQLE